jgi:hypothetical protein
MVAAVGLACCLAAALAGCGGGGSSTKNAEARLRVAFDTVQCDDRAIGTQTEAEERVSVLSIVRADLKLPRVAKLVSDAHAEDKLRAAIRKAAESPGYKPGALEDDLEAAYRLGVKIYADEEALGFRCITPPQKPIRG